jgi:prepilin-type N-terminal cleavage/methylation domain-containing protein
MYNYNRMIKKQGFTLTEVLIAISIAALIIVPFLGFFMNSTKNVQSTRDYVTAIMFAKEAIEDCRSYPFDWLDADSDLTKPPYSAYTGVTRKNFLEEDFANDDGPNDKFWHTKKVGGVEFTRDVDIEPINGNVADIDIMLKEISVTVSFVSHSSNKKVKYTAKACITKLKI